MVSELCYLGNQLILEKTEIMFSAPKLRALPRGIAFPTSISVNHVLQNADNDQLLRIGDLVKMLSCLSVFIIFLLFVYCF